MASYKGFFRPQNPQKYKGDPTKIVYRSRWELLVMGKLDSNDSVIEWSSEEIRIPYISPIDNRRHTYFPDFYVKKRNYSDGNIECILIEVKPKNQTVPPKVQSGKPTRRYITEVYTWGINSAKWDAAEKYCAARGWKFLKLTEDDLNITF